MHFSNLNLVRWRHILCCLSGHCTSSECRFTSMAMFVACPIFRYRAYMNRKSQNRVVFRLMKSLVYTLTQYIPERPPAPALEIPRAPASARHARVLLSAMVKTRIFPVIFLFWSFSCYCIVVYSSYLTVGLSALWI